MLYTCNFKWDKFNFSYQILVIAYNIRSNTRLFLYNLSHYLYHHHHHHHYHHDVWNKWTNHHKCLSTNSVTWIVKPLQCECTVWQLRIDLNFNLIFFATLIFWSLSLSLYYIQYLNLFFNLMFVEITNFVLKVCFGCILSVMFFKNCVVIFNIIIYSINNIFIGNCTLTLSFIINAIIIT